MVALTEDVRSYYEYVDDGKYEALFDLFAEDVTYERPGSETIEGLPASMRFYEQERPLDEGSHEVHDIVVDGDTVAVRGCFSGIQSGEAVQFGFADVHVFDDEGNIAKRYTYTNRDTV